MAEDLPGPGSVFLHTDFTFRAPVKPGDVLTAHGRVTGLRTDKPISTLELSISNQDDVVVLDGAAVVWRDPVVAAATAHHPPHGQTRESITVGSTTAALEPAGGSTHP